MIMIPPIKYALLEQGVSKTNATRFYNNNDNNNIFTHSFNLVKKKIKRILRGATPRHFQGISDIDGEQAHITLEESVVSIVDKRGGTAQFSAYLVPEVRATLLEIEKKFGQRFIS